MKFVSRTKPYAPWHDSARSKITGPAFSTPRRPKPRPGRVRAGRHRNKKAPHSADRPRCVWNMKFKSGFHARPNQRFLRPWFGLVFSTTVIAMMQRGKGPMERTGKDCDCRAQLPSRETWSQRMVSSGNPSHARQLVPRKHVHQKRKEWKRKKKTRDVQYFLWQAWHFCCTPHGPASYRYCSELLRAAFSCHCRRPSSGQGK